MSTRRITPSVQLRWLALRDGSSAGFTGGGLWVLVLAVERLGFCFRFDININIPERGGFLERNPHSWVTPEESYPSFIFWDFGSDVTTSVFEIFTN